MIAILGGTGKEGRGLAARWTKAGLSVVIGSRDVERARSAAAEVAALAGGDVRGEENPGAAAAGDVIVLTPPYDGLEGTIAGCAGDLDGKLVISAISPLITTEGVFSAVPVAEGSAAELVARLAPRSRVGAAFHTISAKYLLALDHDLDEDVPLVADEPTDQAAIVGLCAKLGARGVVVGPLRLARYVEELTPLLLNVNRVNHASAGVRFSGLP